MNWCNDTLIECYDSILYQDHINGDLLKSIAEDLKQVLVCPEKSESAKNQLLSTVTIDIGGDTFSLNQQFIEHSIMLSNEFEMNEVKMAELLYYANRTSSDLSFTDSGKQYYFNRFEYILNILGYLIINEKLGDIVTDFDGFFDNLIASFKKIYKILDNLQDLITKQNLLNNTNEITQKSIHFTKKKLLNCHEILGEIFYNLVDHYPGQYRNLKTYNKVLTHLNATMTDDDLLLIHYLPGVFSIIEVTEPEIKGFHKQITESLNADSKLITSTNDITDLSNSKLKHFEILIDFMFLTNFVDWCKTSKSFNYNFNKDILAYIQICLNYGALENLLRITSTTSHKETIKLFEINNLCDFKYNLEKFPKLQLPKLNDFSIEFEVSPVFTESLLPNYWHLFFRKFITNLAIVLTQLRDNEEDFLLSSINKQKNKEKHDKDLSGGTLEQDVQIDFDEIYSRADLERFYLSFVYTYNYRPQLCSEVWDDDLAGFIMWGVNNNSSPLITASFCLLLSSLTTGDSTKIYDILINNSTLKKTDYSKISIDSIVESLNYYLTSLNESFEKEFNQRQSFFSNEIVQEELVELSNDSMIFINGFLLLSSSIVLNLTNERSTDIRLNLFNRFKPIIIGFLKFDNISNGKLRSRNDKVVVMNESNRVSLHNLIFNLLKSFIQDDIRNDIWKIIDTWIYEGGSKNGFKTNLTDLSSVLNFVELMGGLLGSKPSSGQLIVSEPSSGQLVSSQTSSEDTQLIAYPTDLGMGRNQKGIWPYLEYLINDIFQNSIKINDESSWILQNNLIQLFLQSIQSVDWKFLIQGTNIVDGFDAKKLLNIELNTFVKLHHSLPILNYLYDEKSLKTLFEIIQLEKDETLVKNCLQLVNNLIDLQDVFTHLITLVDDRRFNKTNVIEVINYEIPVIIKLGLLIESSNEDIAILAIDLLSKVKEFSTQSNTLTKNKLLTIYLNCSQSLNLKFAIVNQFNNGTIKLKFKILNFLLNDLNMEVSVAHYILGFKVQGNYLVKDENTLLRTLLDLLVVTLEPNSSAVYYNSLKLSSLILNVVIKLCENPISSAITWDIIRDLNVNLFETLINQYNADSETIWEHHKFNGDLQNSEFVNSKISVLTFFELYNQRILVLKYLTIEFHNIKSIYLKNEYLGLLLNENKFLNGNYRVLNFLDLLNFKFINFERSKFQKFGNFDLNEILKQMKTDDLYDDLIFKKLAITGVDTTDLSKYLTDFIYFDNLKSLQTSYLHNWVQLIEVIINGDLTNRYENFSLEILSNILPKINEFYNTDIIFSEELISLCVLLFDNFNGEIERMIILLNTCIKGIVSSDSTIRLRNDLYVLLNNFLQGIFVDKATETTETEGLKSQLVEGPQSHVVETPHRELLSKTKSIFKNIDFKFFENIINDIIVNEGSIKVVAVILLENLIHLFNSFQDNYLIDNLINNNSLLLIIRLIKRIDEIDDDIIYELTIFRSILNLLIRIGTIRVGASYLIQSELFAIIKNCKILIMDPDLNLKVANELYEILNPIFKLISILLISMGPSYKPSKIQGRDLLNHFSELKNNVIKKDILVNENKLKIEGDELQGMNELINQFILLDSLVSSF